MATGASDIEASAPPPDETSLLLGSPPTKPRSTTNPLPEGPRTSLFLFLEARTPGGLIYEKFTILLILLSVLAFVLSTLFVPQYFDAPLAHQCGSTCDALFFGNDPDNALSFLNIGATSLLEMFIVGVFSIDYILQFATADLLDERYAGFVGRVRFVFSFFSLVDLASTVPFYVDSFLLPNTDLASSNFLRMFRLLRMMRVEGRYDMALGMLDDVFYEQKSILGTALFVGGTVWSVLASFYYLAERKNLDMIYCATCGEDVDTSLCVFDEWGFVDCSAAGCYEGCYNLYESIVDASYWTLINLFGEFPLVDQHSTGGKIVGTITAVIAVAVFALPVGILGSGLGDHISRRREEQRAAAAANPVTISTEEDEEEPESYWDAMSTHVGDASSFRGKVYNYMFRQDSLSAIHYEYVVNSLVVGTTVTFMLDTLSSNVISASMGRYFDVFELLSVVVFTIDYGFKIYSVGENPRHHSVTGLLSYVTSSLPVVDLLSFLPFWIYIWYFPSSSYCDTLVKCLRLLRLVNLDKYTRAFGTFRIIIAESMDILAVTGFSALLIWVLFSGILYLTERDNPNPEMANYYKTVPHAMWITLLNLSGECPLTYYSFYGKIIMGLVGLFATAVFGIPIGILGEGFQERVEDQVEDSPDEEPDVVAVTSGGTSCERFCYRFVNGIGSRVAMIFEILIYVFIIATVIVGIIQTVPGQENTFHQVEWIAVIFFTVEYAIRFIGAAADPEFSSHSSGNCCTSCFSSIGARFKFVLSFYSIIDLFAILPFYLSDLMPGSWVDQHDEYLRMMRLLRLLKLDKYFPSISLIDDVFRLKKKVLIITGYVAITLWIIFAALMYLAEYQDHSMEIDPVPLYGCDDDCTQSDRFRNYFASFVYTGIHLTGDYPLVEYDWLGRIICFFMVIAAVGVVSIPSGVFASGFQDIVTSRAGGGKDNDGDDWFDIKYKELEGVTPPTSRWGPTVDGLQQSAHDYLYGKEMSSGVIVWSPLAKAGRVFFFWLIITNIIAVVAESDLTINRYVGNDPGNFFDVFEVVSVLFFTFEYILHLFAAHKTRGALFSPWVYATTFFGLVDLISIAPWYVQQCLILTGHFQQNDDATKIFRIFRIFRILQLEDFLIAFSKLDNVFRASKDVLKATVVMALVIWVGCGALFFIFEQDNPNFRECDDSVPLRDTGDGIPGCYDFASTAACNKVYPGQCEQTAFANMPDSLFYVAVFLDGEWGVTDFTIVGRLVCMFLCVAGIAVYAIPTGVFVDKFGEILGMGGDDEEED